MRKCFGTSHWFPTHSNTVSTYEIGLKSFCTAITVFIVRFQTKKIILLTSTNALLETVSIKRSKLVVPTVTKTLFSSAILFLTCQYCNPADVPISLVLAGERSHCCVFWFCFHQAMQAKTTVEVKGEISPSTCVYTSCYWYVTSLIPCSHTCLWFCVEMNRTKSRKRQFG